MRLACRLEILPGRTLLQRFGNARRFGFDGVGLPGRLLDSFREELDSCLGALPLPPASLSLGFEGSLLHPRPEARELCRRSLLGLMDLCARWGIGLLNVPPLLLEDNPERIADPGDHASLEERLDALLLERLGDLGTEAGKRGVLFLLEPVNRGETRYLRTLAHGARLCRRAGHPSLKLTLDSYHCRIEEACLGSSIAGAAPHIGHVHLADSGREEPGQGSFDFRSLFASLKEQGYDGWLEVECRTLTGPPGEVLPASADYVRRCWAGA